MTMQLSRHLIGVSLGLALCVGTGLAAEPADRGDIRERPHRDRRDDGELIRGGNRMAQASGRRRKR